ncbi:hypothetical protein HMPREF1580_01367 [Gardnerella vaginalis JCP8070]|nr:hypothetical protein HMPREF1580_01367 [Gardnerella vaginalis JCP8070]
MLTRFCSHFPLLSIRTNSQKVLNALTNERQKVISSKGSYLIFNSVQL